MIDSRKCKTKEDLKEAMEYEHNKCLLSDIERQIFKIQCILDINTFKLNELTKIKHEIKRDILNYKSKKDNAIVY